MKKLSAKEKKRIYMKNYMRKYSANKNKIKRSEQMIDEVLAKLKKAIVAAY